MKQDRFFDESTLIRRLDDESIDNTFLLEIERNVSNDSAVGIDQKEYEVNYRNKAQEYIAKVIEPEIILNIGF